MGGAHAQPEADRRRAAAEIRGAARRDRVPQQPAVARPVVPLDAGLTDTELETRFDQLLAIRGDVSKQLEQARAAKLIGSGLEARVLLAATAGPLKTLLQAERSELATLV